MVTVSKNAGNTTFTFTITGLSAKVDPLVNKWAEYDYNAKFANLFDEGNVLISFDNLTNQQKLNAINARIKVLGLEEANAQENADTFAVKEAEKLIHDLNEVN